jgi:hypothetical protein
MVLPANAYDGGADDDNATAAVSTVSTIDRKEGSDFFYASGASAIFGRWLIKVGVSSGQAGENEAKLMYSLNGVTGPFYDFLTDVSTVGPTSLLSHNIRVSAVTDLRFRCATYKTDAGSSPTCNLWDVQFYELDQSVLWGEIFGGVMTLISDGVSDVTMHQILPPGPLGVLQGGEFLVFSCFARAYETPDDDLEVALTPVSESDELLIVLEPTTHILSTGWRRFAARYEVPSGFTMGPFKLTIRTKSTKAILVARPMFTAGPEIYGYGVNQSESETVPPFPFGNVANFTPGQWTGDYTSMIRIAEVT